MVLKYLPFRNKEMKFINMKLNFIFTKTAPGRFAISRIGKVFNNLSCVKLGTSSIDSFFVLFI